MKMKKRYDQLSAKAQLRASARARRSGRNDTLVERPDGAQEVQERCDDPLWFLPASIRNRPARPFRPYSDRHLGPKPGILPLPEAPPASAAGWWATKVPGEGLAQRYYSAKRLENARLFESEETAFYPYTPVQNPEKSAIVAMYAEVDAQIAALAAEGNQ